MEFCVFPAVCCSAVTVRSISKFSYLLNTIPVLKFFVSPLYLASQHCSTVTVAQYSRMLRRSQRAVVSDFFNGVLSLPA
jgi:hypothetical protein